MAGLNLEIFRFGFYVFFPVAIMFHYGNPEWYEKHVRPAHEKYFPPLESTNKPPTDPHDIRSEIARMKAERLARMGTAEPSNPPSISSLAQGFQSPPSDRLV